jgi:serine/threonine protein kinase
MPTIPPTETDADQTIAPTAPAVKDIPVGEGEIVGPYQLVRWLGSGGMGTVWEAVETKTGRRVALKRLSKSMACDRSYVQRFVREARLCAQVSHPKVTFIYGSGSEQGQPYIAMELMPGKTLADTVEESGQLETAYAVDCIIDAADGLTAAHKLGLIHRDVKPSNCFLDTDDTIKIGDFGLSKSMLGTDVNLTQTGTFMGTPSFAAPEQIRGSELDQRTDIYSVGATLFCLLTGRTPFLGDAMTVTAQIVTEDPPLVSEFNSVVPQGLDRIVAKCMAKEPAKRFQTLDDLKLALIPFASKKDSVFADIGRRLSAFMLDQTLVYAMYAFSILAFSFFVTFRMQMKEHLTPEEMQLRISSPEFTTPIMVGGGIMLLIISILYYAIGEGIFGRGLGKWLMGLRLVNQEGQRVGFLRAALRAVAVPASFGLTFVYLLFVTFRLGVPQTAPDQLMSFLGSTGIGSLVAAICLSTMRTSNGLLGVHGMMSGTKVIRPYSKSLNVPVTAPKSAVFKLKKFGPYESRQMMGESKLGEVYHGHDPPLKRDVWIVQQDKGEKPDLNRINVARVSRQRWLEGGETTDGKRWDAYEAICGVPIQTFVGMRNKADWSLYRRVMMEIVDEVRTSIKEQTLPESLSLAVVWLDKDGHAKLLDRHLVNEVSGEDSLISSHSSGKIRPVGDATENGVRLVQELGNLFNKSGVLPASVQDFLCELNQKPHNASTLDWAHEQLEELSNNLGRISWDTRVGILGATLGLEAVAYLTVSFAIYLVCYYVAPIPNRYRFFTGASLGILLPVLMGYLFRGGPVFRFMGVQVTNSKGRPANGIVSGIRAAISWLPIIAMLGVFILTMLLSEAQMQKTNEIEIIEGSLAWDLVNNKTVIIGMLIVLLASGLSIVTGLIVAVASPTRGLVDFFLRTRLLPK